MTAARNLSSASKFEVKPIGGALGAEISGLDLRNIDLATFGDLRQAWFDHVVLVFRDLSLQPSELVRLANFFGTPISSQNLFKHKGADQYAHELYKLPPEITATSNIKVDGKAVGALGDGEITWHCDHSYNEAPSAARMLYGQEIPKDGPDTCFANQYAAFDLLPNELRVKIRGKTIKQNNTFDLTSKLRDGFDPNEDIRTASGVSHPIISTHPETGYSSIFLGRRRRAYVNGLELSESEELLDELWTHCTQPRLAYVHRWSAGDLVIWDNRCTLHRRDPIPTDSRRLLYATQVKGHRPYEAEDSLQRPVHPRFFSDLASAS